MKQAIISVDWSASNVAIFTSGTMTCCTHDSSGSASGTLTLTRGRCNCNAAQSDPTKFYSCKNCSRCGYTISSAASGIVAPGTYAQTAIGGDPSPGCCTHPEPGSYSGVVNLELAGFTVNFRVNPANGMTCQAQISVQLSCEYEPATDPDAPYAGTNFDDPSGSYSTDWFDAASLIDSYEIDGSMEIPASGPVLAYSRSLTIGVALS